MISGVYLIRNTVNGKVYVGSSQNIELRWRRHRNELDGSRHHSKHLQRAWNLDGSDAFVFEIVRLCGKEELTIQEQAVLTELNSANPNYGYNVSAVAGSRRGVRHSEEVRTKMSKAAKCRPPKSDAENKAHGLKLKAKIAAGEFFTEEHREKISASLRGKKRSEETVQRMRENCGGEPTVFVNVDGELMTVKMAAKHYGIAESSMRKRLRVGSAIRVDRQPV